MRTLVSVVLVLASSPFVGCSAEGETAVTDAPPHATAGSATVLPLEAAPRILAFTEDGRLALVDATTGAIIDQSTQRTPEADRDVAYDPGPERAIVFAPGDAGEGGELGTVRID